MLKGKFKCNKLVRYYSTPDKLVPIQISLTDIFTQKLISFKKTEQICVWCLKL